MLLTLNIRDFVIVDALEIDFAGGFTVFSGETGAGKSILVDALALTLGEKVDAGVVREGAARAEVIAQFAASDAALHWLDAQDIERSEPLLLRRVVDNQGRSKSWINGSAATLTQLRELGELLVDIHGQHAHQRLLRSQEQRLLLDEQAGLSGQAGEVASDFKVWQNCRDQRLRFESDAETLLREREQLEWQVSELTRLSLAPGEWEMIELEHARLAHAAALIEGSREILDALAESEGAVLDRLAALVQRLTHLGSIDASLEAPLESLDTARIHAQEAASALHAYLDRLELDPERLAELEARIAAIHTAARRFKVGAAELPEVLTAAMARLARLSGASDLEGLRLAEDQAHARFMTGAQALSRARDVAAVTLGKAVTKTMQALSMEGGLFRIALNPADPSSHGLENIEFQVATHPGATPRALHKVASGGELARISLALSVVASASKTVPTLIFDEVDSGIGGAVAEVVGRLLRQLGTHCQVLCVTHLAQVAAQAQQQFAVTKIVVGGRTVSQIAALDPVARIDELARMLGGIDITATTRKHARELLAAVLD